MYYCPRKSIEKVVKCFTNKKLTLIFSYNSELMDIRDILKVFKLDSRIGSNRPN